MPVLIPAARAFQRDLDKVAPNRVKPDGWIGDAAHRQRESDHNPDETGKVPIIDADKIDEVHAIDVNHDLRSSISMESIVQKLLDRCRKGLEKRIRYIIYKRRIWKASNGWKEEYYDGDNPHDHHVHLSFSYTTSLEADTSSYELGGNSMDTAQAYQLRTLVYQLAAITANGTNWKVTASSYGPEKSGVNGLAAKLEQILDAIDVSTGQLITAVNKPKDVSISDDQLTRCLVQALRELARA